MNVKSILHFCTNNRIHFPQSYDSQTTSINVSYQWKTEKIFCLISVLWTNIAFNTSRSVLFGAYLLAPVEQPAWRKLQGIFFEWTQNAINLAYLLTFSVLTLQQIYHFERISPLHQSTRSPRAQKHNATFVWLKFHYFVPLQFTETNFLSIIIFKSSPPFNSYSICTMVSHYQLTCT